MFTFFTNDELHSQSQEAIEATEKLITEQLAAVEKVQGQLREHTDAVLKHTMATTRISIDAMLAAQKATLEAFAPAEK